MFVKSDIDESENIESKTWTYDHNVACETVTLRQVTDPVDDMSRKFQFWIQHSVYGTLYILIFQENLEVYRPCQ